MSAAQLVDKGILPERAESLGGEVFPGWKGSPGVALSSTLDTAATEVAAGTGSRIDPDGSLSPGLDPHLAIRLKELELEIKIQEREAEGLYLRALQIHADRELELRRMSIVAAKPVPLPQSAASLAAAPSAPKGARCGGQAAAALPVSMPQSPACSTAVCIAHDFDVSCQIGLVPVFRENEVDAYFPIFERIATTLNWPKSLWSLLLQCKLVGKAQEVCSSLSLEQILDYELVKATILRAYELIPEAYRQNFRKLSKNPSQTFFEFAREKTVLFEKWCLASNVTTFDQFKELMLLGDFKDNLPEKIVIYLNEQKVTSLSVAATLADEFVLTHKTVCFSTLP
ncbi:hypothetical protein AOLI_G00202850 [Acnodon oligacanthus]